MLVHIKITPSARKDTLEVGADGRFLVTVRAPRKEGKANDQLCVILAEYFHVARKQVIIVRGKDRSSKTVRIDGVESLKG